MEKEKLEESRRKQWSLNTQTMPLHPPKNILTTIFPSQFDNMYMNS
jgi:hypothetical protein